MKVGSISVDLENYIKNSNKVIININFLGSGHPASKHPRAGKQYGNYKHVYYNFSFDEYTNAGQENILIINMTFSGPTTLDIKKPNVKSITKEAQFILNDLIPDISLFKKKICINIEGHSRGGIVANNVHQWLLSLPLGNGVTIGNLSIADPYAGPVNRRTHETMRNFDNEKVPVHMNVPSNKIVVYSVAERRFRTPARSLQSDIVVFTDVSHDTTKYVSDFIFKHLSNYKEGIYIFEASNDDFNRIIKPVFKQKEGPTKKEQEFIDKWMEKCLDLVTLNNIGDILESKGKYKNFSYNKISSDGRRELFYKALSVIDREQVKDFLNKKNKIMCKRIQEM